MNHDAIVIENKAYPINFLIKKGADRELATDLYQDLYIKTKITLETGLYFENERAFKTWLFTVAGNLFIDVKRKEQRSKKYLVTDFENTDGFKYNNFSNIKDNEPTQEEIELKKSVTKELIDAQNKIAKEQKEIVNLHIYKGWKFRDIAEELNISVNTAIGRFRYAKINLKRILQLKST